MIAISRLAKFSNKDEPNASATRWGYRQLAVTLGFTALLVFVVLGIGNGAHLVAAAQELWAQPKFLAAFLLTYTLAFYLRALAWQLLIPKGPSTNRLFAILQVALLANHLFPTKVGEVVRIGLLTRRGVPMGVAVSSTLIARLIDFAAVCLIALALLLVAGGRLDSYVGLLALPIAIIILSVLACYLIASRKQFPLASRVPARFLKIAREAQASLAAISVFRLLTVVLIVIPSWFLEAGALWSVAQVAGVPLPLAAAVGATAFAIAFQGFQFTPGGIGLYEASLTGVLAFYGVDPAAALTLAIVTHALKFAYSYLVGFPCLVSEGFSSSNLRLSRRFASLYREFRRSGFSGCLTAKESYVVFAAVAYLVYGAHSGALSLLSYDLWTSLAAGLAATAPLVVLGCCHHLPGRLSYSLFAVLLLFLLIFGLPAPIPGLVALLIAGVCLLLTELRGSKESDTSAGANPPNALSVSSDVALVSWPFLLTQSIAAGSREPVPVAGFGLMALLLLLFLRQWWLAHHPLPRPEPPAADSILAVLIPVHNEAITIASVLAGMPRTKIKELGFEMRVVVVDDGSTDGSGEIARVSGADLVIRHPQRRGLGAAVRTGLSAAHRIGAGAAVYLDGDGEYNPADIPNVAGPILRGEADYVLGSRLPHAAPLMRRSRRVGNLLFTAFVSLLSGCRIIDGQTGFRAFSARALVSAEIIHDYNYAQVLTLDLLRKRMRLAQTPISYRTRRHGKSFIRYRQYLQLVLPAIVREVAGP